MQEILQLADFTPHVGSCFVLPFEDGSSVSLTLTLAEALPITPFPGRTRDPFHLRFVGPESAFLPQQTYIIQHPAFVSLVLFLVPIGKEAAGFIYQSVFS